MSQFCAIIWRYLLTLYLTPVRTVLRTFLAPIAMIALVIYLSGVINLATESIKLEMKPTVMIISYLMPIATAFHIFYHCGLMVTDKSTGFRGLMFTMGLKRDTYYFANYFILAVYLCIITLILGFIANANMPNTKASTIEILALFTLLAIQLTGFTFALSSLLTSTVLVQISFIFVILGELIHYQLGIGLQKVEQPALKSIILFLINALPYESLRLFRDSYAICLNCNEIRNGTMLRSTSMPTYFILISMLFWSVFSFAFARWFDEVCPWQTESASKSLLFCLFNNNRQSSKDRRPSHSQASQNEEESKLFEKPNSQREIGIQLNEVSKIFNNIPVVDRVNFKVYKGETTLLLGHNGAGKTTLMNLILGKLNLDSGDVTIKRNHSSSGQSLGICPQTSILDENLTVSQHIRLFAKIKQTSNSVDFERHIESTLFDVGLQSHLHKLPNELSGGMKRKLSLGIAFVGNSEVLILDEPSSGLDPDSRVFVWNAIRRYRSQRTVLLSTQHMEEADYLGDRVAIMRAGQIICCGSTTFLSKAFNLGYRLRVECQHVNRDQVIAFVQSFFPQAWCTETVAADRSGQGLFDDTMINMVIDLKKSSSDSDRPDVDLIRLLKTLETDHRAHHIRSYGLRCSSVEDVMLKTGRDQPVASGSVRVQVQPKPGETDDRLLAIKSRQTGSSSCLASYMRFLNALIIKHLHSYQRNVLNIVFMRILLPIAGSYLLIFTIEHHNPTSPPQTGTANLLFIFHFIYYPAKEQISKFKTMQLTSFAGIFVYWMSQLLVDMISIAYLIGCINVTLWLMHSGQHLAHQLTMHLLISLAMLLFGIASAFFAYVISTVIESSTNPVGLFSIIFVSSFAVVFVFDILLSTITGFPKWITDVVRYFFIAILPTDALQHFASGLYHDHSPSTFRQTLDGPTFEISSPRTIGLIALAAQIVGYTILLIIIEYKVIDLNWYIRNATNCLRNSICCSQKSALVNYNRIEVDDDDVIAETTKASQVINRFDRHHFSLVASNLSKSYIGNIKVVDRLAFTVGRGECFGLLGINGSGKTTTFSMIAAEVKPDSGRICLKGYYLVGCNAHQYRHHLGYDPQTTPELYMTPTEALYLMARLRQVDEQSIPELVRAILYSLDMVEHENKPTQKLSGGNQRKLALGMSLIGCPEFLVLDEPTAGVDPLARRSIWRLLRSLQVNGNASIVIASHAMEECEAICDRISIMARGRLRCVGSFLHLSSKFSRGYRVKVQFTTSVGGSSSRLSEDELQFKSIIQQLDSSLRSKLGASSVTLVDTNVNSASFIISDKQVPRSALFGALHEFKQLHSRMSYTVDDSSLEDIFLNLAREEQALQTTLQVV